MTATFELYRDKTGEYRFRLKAGNGQIIATGQGYASRSGALQGIESVKKNAASADVVEITVATVASRPGAGSSPDPGEDDAPQ
ncbi:YegP family protein [Arthrobacter cavernae]|uniref:YegP family protein n=1 Tax=Arthrobacter cavernae TaxID=2817681 RepID=A0A939KLH9_9MICC|nr:YegP family protein [Arthrobacter cavernae]MBO1269969.1 YegP family protein [Arthrobacter cavernae]